MWIDLSETVNYAIQIELIKKKFFSSIMQLQDVSYKVQVCTTNQIRIDAIAGGCTTCLSKNAIHSWLKNEKFP